MRENRVAGMMIAPCGFPTPETARLLSQIPAVQFLRRNDALGATGVYADDCQGIWEATRHLLLLKHRRIGYIGPSRALSTGAQRLEGHEAALRQMGVAIDESLYYLGPARPDAGYEGLKALLTRPRPPTAIVAASSQQLLGVLRALRESGTDVPQSLSLVAYGDTPWFEACNPAVTAVALPVDQMCETASSLLFKLIEGEGNTPAGGVAAGVCNHAGGAGHDPGVLNRRPHKHIHVTAGSGDLGTTKSTSDGPEYPTYELCNALAVAALAPRDVRAHKEQNF